MDREMREYLMGILKFIASAGASFGLGWGMAVLQGMDGDGAKAIAHGVVGVCTYILGVKQEKVDMLPPK